MPRTEIPKREVPKEEISNPIEKHNREWGQHASRDEAKAVAAVEASSRPQAEAHARDFAMAKERLAKLTLAQVHDFLRAMPSGILELYLLAEEDTKNRSDILRFYPKPSIGARERYLPKKKAQKKLAIVDA